MRRAIQLAIIAAIIALFSVPLAAKKPAAPKPPKSTVTKTQAPKSSTKAPKPANVSAPKAATASAAKAPKAPKAPKTAKSSTTTPTPGGVNTPNRPEPTPPLGGSETATTLSPLAQKLSGKPNHLAKLQQALGGTTTLTAEQLNGITSGFKNFGQLNAAVNTVLHNPTVEFADLKLLMTGMDMNGKMVEGQTIYSLGQAKQRLGIADGDPETTSSTATTTSATGKSKKRSNTSGGTQ